MQFKDRKDAGQRLATELMDLNLKNPYIFGMARGGVPVAYEVAKKLKVPLDVLVIRKLGMPENPEFGFGAIAPEGIMELNRQTVKEYNLDQETIEAVKNREEKELDARLKKYRGSKKFPNLLGKTVILVDDGIATGASARVAVKYLRSKNPKKIILASPTCAKDSEENLKKYADDVVCLISSLYFSAVGQWYEIFDQTDDKEVISFLDR